MPSKDPQEGSVSRGKPGAGPSCEITVPGGDGTTADAEVSLVTDCVRDACREVDLEVMMATARVQLRPFKASM